MTGQRPPQLVGWDGEWEHDADGWRLDGDVPGPAGLAPVVTSVGLVVDVDVANPSTITGLWVRDSVDVAHVQDHFYAARTHRVRLGRLALADDVLEPGPWRLDDVTRALAEVDRALASRALRTLIDADTTRRRIRQAVSAVSDVADELFAVDRPDLVADAIRSLIEGLDPGDPHHELASLADALDDAARVEPASEAESFSDVAFAPMAASYPAAPARQARSAAAPVSALLDIVDIATLPDGVVAEQIAVRATSASEIEVRIGAPVAARRWWARAHRSDGRIIAVAPIRPDENRDGDSGALARLLVPPADAHHVTLDVTDRPGDPRPSRLSTGIVNAVRMGRQAARNERAGRTLRAIVGWESTAQAWRAVSDDVRAGDAQHHASPSFATLTRAQPLLSDLTDD